MNKKVIKRPVSKKPINELLSQKTTEMPEDMGRRSYNAAKLGIPPEQQQPDMDGDEE